MRALDAALNVTWAMEERALETLLDIAARENEVTPEALEAYRAKALANGDRVRARDGVAVIDAVGALFKRANLFTAISGATSYSIMRADLQAALDDPTVRAIMLNIDSPGGEASGSGELSQAIYDARGKKPIVAYVGGRGASAAYWIASAADRVVVDPSAVLGSIGVQVAASVREPKPGEKSYRFVSSQSPNKNPELGTEQAAEQIQTMIDAMAQVFVADVARNRGVATETVLSDFGKGGIFVGQQAIDAGLADSIGSFESVLAELTAGAATKGNTGLIMATETETGQPEAVDNSAAIATAVAAALTAERTRMAGLQTLATAHGAADVDLQAAITGNMTVEAFALQIADKAAKDKADNVAALQRDEEEARPAGASRAEEPTAVTVETVAQSIINAAAAARGEAK